MLHIVSNSDWDRNPGLAEIVTAPAPPSHTFAMNAIARMLGVHRRSERWIVRYLTALIEQEDFPAPLPTLVRGEIRHDIHARKSHWLATPVRAWFLDRTPAHAVATTEDAKMLERAAAAQERLDARADNLFERRS